MNKELTDWFPADTVPFHEGAYEIKLSHPIIKTLFWDGKKWTYPHNGDECLIQRQIWRGLVHNPNVSK